SDQNIVLDEVRGDLTYRTESGLQADTLSAKWFGKPVAIKVATAAAQSIAIDAQGRVAMSDLRQWLRQPLFDFASGDAPFKSTLRIANGATVVQVDSDLLGVAIDLPPPYRKVAEQSLPLAVMLELNAEPNLTATLSDWADLRLRWDRTDAGALQLAAGVVRLGEHGREAMQDGQFIVTGKVDSTDLNEWRSTLRNHPATLASDQSEESEGKHVAVQIRELQFDRAQIAGRELRNLIVSGRRDSAAWTLQARAEQIAGTFTLPDDANQPWRAQLNYLRLPKPAGNTANTQNAAVENTDVEHSPIADLDPRNAIAVDLSIDHLWYGDEDIGSVATQVRPIENGMRLEDVKGQLRAVKIEAREQQPASLTWVRDEAGDHSNFVGRLSVSDIGKVLQRWHYEPVVASKRGYVDADLKWAGRPDQFQFVQTDGHAAIRVEDGRFTRASGSTTGALKVVGIFNFANFLRRLQFDFSDIYKEGVSFDEIQGSFKTENGVLAIEEPIEIKSPSSRFRLVGQIDFNNDQTDMELVATLPVASNLPWVAALTGTGLPIAAGVYVASKVFENQFDRFSSAAYEVSGPWSDPQVKLRRVFDDQLPKKDMPPQKTESTEKPADTAPAPEAAP
ncbi:MAG TPA: AsmA-like C-terminal region-containing protein, partial [Spongiibacteraceae bacterium]|nr:AsmA-like C-terminal region-containing protein [Spongiibacteraceae bacterium]